MSVEVETIFRDATKTIKRCALDISIALPAALAWYGVFTAHGDLDESPLGKFCTNHPTFPLCSWATTHPLQVLGFLAFLPVAAANRKNMVQFIVAAAAAAAFLPALSAKEYIAIAAAGIVITKARLQETKITIALAVFFLFWFGYLEWANHAKGTENTKNFKAKFPKSFTTTTTTATPRG